MCLIKAEPLLLRLPLRANPCYIMSGTHTQTLMHRCNLGNFVPQSVVQHSRSLRNETKLLNSCWQDVTEQCKVEKKYIMSKWPERKH